jgi:hypothetical protein
MLPALMMLFLVLVSLSPRYRITKTACSRPPKPCRFQIVANVGVRELATLGQRHAAPASSLNREKRDVKQAYGSEDCSEVGRQEIGLTRVFS